MASNKGAHSRQFRSRFFKPGSDRFGPYRPAADMEGNGEFHFWVEFLRILETFLKILEEFWRHLFVVRKNFHQTEKTTQMRF